MNATSRDPGNQRVSACLKRLVAHGDSSAQYRLACCYAEGNGVEQDDVTACKWFESAASGGYAPAMFRLGLAHLNGDGYSLNRVRGLYWLLKAANRGNLDAMKYLGISYYNGDCLPKRRDLAISWFRKAANHGCFGRMLLLGNCYRLGNGVEQNIVKAFVCYNVWEARTGDSIGRALKAQWTADLTDEQLAEVKRLSHKMINGGPLDL